MTDFHAHILPEADHGSNGLETSLRQLRMAQEAGIRTVVATPHFYPQQEDVEPFLQRRQRAYEQLMKAYSGRVRVLLGAEVQLCAGLNHLPGLNRLCIAGTNTLLVEMPFAEWTENLCQTLLTLQDSPDYTPVLAHVDRYYPPAVAELLRSGVLGQLNAQGLCRLRGRRRLLQWVCDGFVAALGSDIHGTQTGYRQFQRAVRILGNKTEMIMERTERLL